MISCCYLQVFPVLFLSHTHFCLQQSYIDDFPFENTKEFSAYLLVVLWWLIVAIKKTVTETGLCILFAIVIFGEKNAPTAIRSSERKGVDWTLEVVKYKTCKKATCYSANHKKTIFFLQAEALYWVQTACQILPYWNSNFIKQGDFLFLNFLLQRQKCLRSSFRCACYKWSQGVSKYPTCV